MNWSSWVTSSSVLGSNPKAAISAKFKPWSEWVEDLHPKFGARWRSNGIYDSIMLSKKNIGLNLPVLGTAMCYWSSTSNTFDFGLGPVTHSIIDMASLFGNME